MVAVAERPVRQEAAPEQPSGAHGGHGRLGYQPALDGLRAIAVAAVIAYHLDLGSDQGGGVRTILPGGFLGVDLFFVLSGFLITGLLADEWAGRDTVRFARFWARRLKRLAPALIVMIAAVVVWTIVRGDFTRAMRTDAASAFGYVANWRFALSGQSYFESFGGVSPLRHTWSLAIEEQWYLVWPVVSVWAMRRGGIRLAATVALAGAAASAMWMWAVSYGSEDVSRAYYGTDTRAHALLIGSLGALAVRSASADVVQRVCRVLAPLALVGVGAAFVLLGDDERWVYGAGFAMFALVALVAMIGVVGMGGARPPILGRLLAVTPLVMIGRISYGLYLWHWPVIVLVDESMTGLAGGELAAAHVGITIVLAVASYVIVERPVRFARSNVPAVLLGAGLLAAVPATFLLPVSADGDAIFDEAAPSTLNDGASADAVRVIVPGDSVAFSLGWWFEPADVDGQLAVQLEADPGCGLPTEGIVTAGVTVERKPACIEVEARWPAAISAFRPDVALFVLGGWELYDVKVDGRAVTFGTPEWEEYLAGRLDAWAEPLRAEGIPIAVTDVPCYAEQDNPNPEGPGRERYDEARVDVANEFIATYASTRPDVSVLPLASTLCTADRVPIEASDRWDGLHFNQGGATRVWSALAPALIDLAATAP
jgi:peptidoglycan/LPS O-acetylase OafA/YrhL/lysophospholipase L1-like esterase